MITLQADRVKVNGPRIDGSYTVTFECGEYMNKEISKLFLIPQGTMIELKVKYEKEKENK